MELTPDSKHILGHPQLELAFWDTPLTSDDLNLINNDVYLVYKNDSAGEMIRINDFFRNCEINT